ncbi:MAG: ATP-dependent Clp protease ATP-binding subunit ClpX [Chitinophagaceae bacterium]|nr:ATP-dependent Clp protease ATP-binding subunit ClpX [Chitinophagaceae bacterium]
MAKEKSMQCSFCLKTDDEVIMMISGAKANICNECVENAAKIIENEIGPSTISKPAPRKNKGGKKEFDYKPVDIKNYLDQYVIGQEDAKKVLSVAIYNHYKRINQNTSDDVEIEKSNVIMIGETGTGKTLMAKTVAKMLNVPFAIADATVFTEAGYVGEDVESILSRLLQAANYDVEQTQRGIVFIDEIDKIGRKTDNPSITRDVSGEGVQQALLKLLEGSDVLVPPQGGRKHPEQKMVSINTQNILFICGGAFEGIDKVIEKRITSTAIGFKSSKAYETVKEHELIQYVNAQDLRSFGLIPELLGRIPIVTYLKSLDASALKRILTEPKNALIKQYIHLFKMEGIQLVIEEPVLDYIVSKAIEYKLGGRGLRSICELLMTDAMFELPGQTSTQDFVITLDYAKEKIEKSKYAYLKVA